MSDVPLRRRGPPPLDRLPTLTEVVHAGDESHPPRLPQPAMSPEEALSQAVLGAVAQRMHVTLEARLREALAPALARAADTLIREARDELTAALRDEVARAVRQEILRHRKS